VNPGAEWQWAAGLSTLGFYFFLAVWVGVFLWSRTKEKLAIQETLQKLIQSGAQLTPEVIDSLRRTKAPRTLAEITARVRTFRYWGIFLIGLGTAIALWGLQFTDSPNRDLHEIPGAGIVTFIIPGLFCIAYSVITSLVNRSSKT
jgi:hypothetical protein